jgi:putative flavoprotein involved in K+ transport
MDRLQYWVTRFESAVLRGGLAGIDQAAGPLFHEQSYWRDLVLFTWNIVTFEGRDSVAEALLTVGRSIAADARIFTLKEGPNFATKANADQSVISGWFDVQTDTTFGVAHVELRRDDAGSDLCSVLFTSASELRGFEEAAGPRRPLQAQPLAPVTDDPYVLVVGGSQSGLMLAARLRRLGVPALVVDKNALPGDGWRSRYSSLHLHDPVWVTELPYLPFPDDWPVYASKDQFGNWLDLYAQAMGIQFQGGTEVLKASYDTAAEHWCVLISHQGAQRTIRAYHVVLATGNQSLPNIPDLFGIDTFLGQVTHSSKFTSCGTTGDTWRGKQCIVLGSNTSAHDIAQDLCEHNACVTMLQRSKTCVAKIERVRELCAGGGYSEDAVAAGLDASTADLLGQAMPYALRVPCLQEWVQDVKTKDAKFYTQLEQKGWMQDWGEDATGLYMMFIRRFGGFYFDIGASQRIIDGHIKLQTQAEISEVRPRSVVLNSGEELPCDLLVLATGYQNMTMWVEKLMGPEVARAVGPCWGLGSGTRGDPGPYEGELRNMWKPTAQPGLWFHGGNIALSRFFSLHLALQLKARFEKISLKVHGDVGLTGSSIYAQAGA